MTLPPWTSARIAISGLRAAIVGAAFILLLGAFAVQTVRLEGLKVWPFEVTGWIAKAKAREAERDAERTAHQTTKDEYRAAQAQAALLEAARLKRVRQQQEEITNAIEKDYRGQLADLGARAERLRTQLRARAEPAGPPAGERGAPLRNTAGRADGATGDHRLSSAGGEPARIGPLHRTAEEQLERDIVATQQALQLDALIDWVEQQTAIDPNAGPD